MKEFRITEFQRAECFANILELMKKGEITKEGIIISCNQEKVNKLLFERNHYTEDELIDIRNNYVYCLSELIEEAREEDFELADKFINIMTVITGTIDKRIYERI